MKPKFSFLTGDVDWLTYGGKWISQKFNNGDFDYWLVRSLDNLHESGNEDQDKYYCTLYVVAPEEFNDKRQALSICGWDDSRTWDDLTNEEKVLVVTEYSGGAVAFTCQGNNYKDLFKQVQKEAELCTGLFGFYMDRYQNAVGATGWDLVRGDVWGSLKTGVEA